MRGFASMTPERRREVAAIGGRMAHQTGRGHEWSASEARAASVKSHLRLRARGNHGHDEHSEVGTPGNGNSGVVHATAGPARPSHE